MSAHYSEVFLLRLSTYQMYSTYEHLATDISMLITNNVAGEKRFKEAKGVMRITEGTSSSGCVLIVV